MKKNVIVTQSGGPSPLINSSLRGIIETCRMFPDKFGIVPLQKVALSERFFPEKWIDKSRVDVTDEFIDYVRPLIGEDWVSVPIINGRRCFTQLNLYLQKKNYLIILWKLFNQINKSTNDK